MEIWKDVKNYEGRYQISNFGNVKSLNYKRTKKERLLKSVIDGSGYNCVLLYVNGKRKQRNVHQLVAESFLNHEPCGFKLVINHIDLNKLNNNVSNLEIISTRQNSNRKHLKSSSKYVGVSWNKREKKWVTQIIIEGKKKHLGYFVCETKAHLTYQNKLKTL